MLGLFFFISYLACSTKLPSHLWSYGNLWPLQYEQSQALHLNPSNPTFFLHVKHREWFYCLEGGCSGTSGTLKFCTSYLIPSSYLCFLNCRRGTWNRLSTCWDSWGFRRIFGILCKRFLTLKCLLSIIIIDSSPYLDSNSILLYRSVFW